MKRHAPEILKVQEGVCRVLESVIIEMLVLPKIILKVFSLLFFVGRLQSINIYIHMLKEIKSNYHSVYLISKQPSESKYISFSVRMKNIRRLSDDSV